MELTFTSPSFLFLLFIIPLLIFFHFIGIRKHRKNALKFANFDAIAKIKGIEIYSKSFTSLFLSIIIILLLILSVSGATLHTEKPTSSFSFVIAVDASRSMEANDLTPSRIEVAKSTALNFINDSPLGVRVGVISFSSNSLVEREMTENKDLAKSSVRAIELSSIGGTDIYDAVVTSTNLMGEESSKAVIILSDGQINVGNINDTIDYAIKNDVVVHTIGMGTDSGGSTSFGISTIDGNSLRSLSYGTGGEFYRVTSEQELDESFDSIRGLKIGRVSISLAPYLLVIVVFLFFLQYLFNTFGSKVL